MRNVQLDRLAKAYIIGCIYTEPYDIPEPKTDAEKVKALREIFYSEYGWRVEQVGETRALADWFQGLPTCCTVAFYNGDILDIARVWGSLPEDASPRQEEKILGNWWNFLANKTGQLFRKYT